MAIKKYMKSLIIALILSVFCFTSALAAGPTEESSPVKAYTLDGDYLGTFDSYEDFREFYASPSIVPYAHTCDTLGHIHGTSIKTYSDVIVYTDLVGNPIRYELWEVDCCAWCGGEIERRFVHSGTF